MTLFIPISSFYLQSIEYSLQINIAKVPFFHEETSSQVIAHLQAIYFIYDKIMECLLYNQKQKHQAVNYYGSILAIAIQM